MMNQTQVNQLCEDNELALFRADVCLGSPQSFTLEKKARICEDMDATHKAIEDAIRTGFEAPLPSSVTSSWICHALPVARHRSGGRKRYWVLSRILANSSPSLISQSYRPISAMRLFGRYPNGRIGTFPYRLAVAYNSRNPNLRR